MSHHQFAADRRIAAAPTGTGATPDLGDQSLLGDTVHDAAGHHIGTVTGVQPPGSPSPRWVTVSKGITAVDPRAVPLYGAGRTDTGIQVAVNAVLVDGAPDTWMSRPIDATNTPDLFMHYAGHLGRAPTVGADARRP